MTSIGEKLRQKRLQLNLDLSQVAGRTRINAKILEAIEAEQWDRIPGTFFARSFTRQYAAALGFDVAEVDTELEKLFGADVSQPLLEPELAREKIHLPPLAIGSASSRRPGRRLLLPSLAFAAILLAGWAVYTLWPNWRRAEKPAVPAPPAKAVQRAAPGKSKPLAPEDRLLVVLTASGTTWVSLSMDGRQVFEDILTAGEARTFEGKEIAILHVGNAGGLDIRVNGKPVGPVGGEGQVRIIKLTRDGWQPAP